MKQKWIEIPVYIDIKKVYDDSIDFNTFVKKGDGEFELLQDEIIMQNADELYELACEIANDEAVERAEEIELDKAEQQYEDEKIKRFMGE
jgi:hypothetical protein